MGLLLGTLLIGTVGGIIGERLRLPAGALLGAMLAVGAMNLVGGDVASLPRPFRTTAKILVGTYLGGLLTLNTLRHLKTLAFPAALMLAITIGAGLIGGILLSRLAGVDIYTALLGSAPGGSTEMTLVALSYDEAEPPLVAALQVIRIIGVILIVPLVVRLFFR
jgi:membrane AbrB-like protein